MIKAKSFLIGFIGSGLSIVLANIVLSWVFTDLGRLIYINVSCLSLVALMMYQDAPFENTMNRKTVIMAWVLCILFVTSWRLIYYHSNNRDALLLYNLFMQVYTH
jgi:hypothetical protein